jgi:NAD(P)-dependent dehydrogenase (short-subunit alcohol dehydrogenase family)
MRRVLVTGSSSGIGLEIARHLRTKGYKVFQTGRREPKEFNAPDYFRADLTLESDFQALLNFVGNVDVLINNAGEYLWAPVENTGTQDVSRITNLNFAVPYRLISHFVVGMKKQNQGRIVNIGSISGTVGEGNASLYSATKSALLGLTKSLALELAEFGITVNLINPGWVETELAQNALSTSDFSRKECEETIPQKRFIQPSEVAHLAEYLISDEAKGLTGQSINLCAGLSVG